MVKFQEGWFCWIQRFLLFLCLVGPCISGAGELEDNPHLVFETLQEISRLECQFDEHSMGYLRLAMDTLFVNPKQAAEALSEFIRLNDKILRDEGLLPLDGLSAEELLPYAAAMNPEMLRHLNLALMEGLIHAFTVISTQVKTAKLDTGSSLRRWKLSKNFVKAEKKTLQALNRLKGYLSHAPQGAQQNFWAHRSQLFTLHAGIVDALTHLWSTASEWAEEISASVQRFIVPEGGQSRSFYRTPYANQRRIFSAIGNQQKNAEIFRAWINGENATVAALSALLIVEGACTIISGGLCAGTIPVTVGVMGRVGQATLTSARVVVVANAAVDLVDRYRIEGAGGLANVQSLVDALLIVSLIPHPTLKMLGNQSKIALFGQELKISDLAVRVAYIQQASSRSLAGVAAGYGLYQVLRAQKIASDMTQQGMFISASEIRTQGVVNLLLGMIGGLRTYQYHQSTLKDSPAYREHLQRLAAKDKGWKGILERLSPTRSVGNILRGLWRGGQAMGGNGKTVWENFKFAGAPLATGMALSAYQFFAYGTYTMLGFTYSDYFFRRHTKELPELRDGEIALILNGFSTNDLLYYGFSTPYAHRREIEKYLKPGSLYYGFFKTPREFFEQIATFGKHYGKIRYLKVMTHGIPGKLIPDASRITGEGEDFIDAEFLSAHETRIRAVGQHEMAPDAQIVLVSCLVGGNLEEDTHYKGIQIKKDAGDVFIHALGKSMLPHGGSIDSSRRILLALEGIFLPAFDSMTGHGHPSEHVQVALQKIERIREEYADLFAPVDNAATVEKNELLINKESVDFSSLMYGVGHRLINVMRKVWEIAYTFGIQLEGGYFFDKHHRVEFPVSDRAERSSNK